MQGVSGYLFASDSVRKNGDEEGAQKLVSVSADYATIYDVVCKDWFKIDKNLTYLSMR